MTRGQIAAVGTTRVAKNGYEYTKCEEGWRLTHHIVAEKILGRKLRKDERVLFKDKNKTNFAPENIIVTPKGQTTVARNVAALEAERDRLTATINELSSRG